jgi:1,2-diacylglycerol 3-alpha-glucosyltransferase
MRIGLFTDGYLPGITGVATSVDAAARELEARGHTVILVAPKYPGYKDSRPVIRLRSMPIPTKRDLRIATYLPGTSLMMATQLDLDIVHGHAGGPITMLGWEVARIKRIPFIVTYHTLFNQYTHYILNGKVIRPKMAEMATKVFSNTADHVIAPTEKVKSELLSYGVKKPISVMPAGIDLAKFHPQSGKFLHDKAGVAPDRRLLLFVGRLGKEKSIDYLLKAFAVTAKQYADVDLVLVGDGPERHNLEKLCRELKIASRVHFTGFIKPDQIPLAYSDATLLVFCSTSETQGLAVPESMACGLPPVVVDDPAYKDIVKNGVNGLIAKRGVKGFSAAVASALDNPDLLSSMSTAALQTAKGYSLSSSVDQLESLYTKLISKHD